MKTFKSAIPAGLCLLALLTLLTAARAEAAVFQAEDYDAYYDTTPGNTGGAYRSDDVDIEATADSGGGHNVGWIAAGEWLAYNNLNIPTSGNYIVRFRVASSVGGTLSNDLNGGSIVLGSLNIPNTGGWQNWQTISHTVHIDAGTYSLGVYASTGDWNLNWMEVVPESPPGGGSYGIEPLGGSAALFYVNTSGWADVHYNLNSQGQQNYRMVAANGRQEWQLNGLNSGDLVQYFFTYSTPTGAMDTPWATYTHSGGGSSSSSSSGGSSGGGSFDPGNPSPGGTHPRLTIHNGCPTETMWVHWLTVPGFLGGVLNAPNHTPVASGQSISYDIPDKGLAAMRFWPAFGCDGSGMDCRIGASGGPQDFGFDCPPEGCAPPIDSKFEATFGCITGIADSQCQTNPSGGAPLGRSDWWNSSAVDGFTVPIKVDVNGYCPQGPVESGPFAGPGGPAGGVIDCSGLSLGGCPRNADLSTDGQFPHLANMDLLAVNPSDGQAGGCYSPAGKLTYGNWGNTPTYTPDAPEAQMYTCPTPPISEAACRAGPADRSAYRNYIHSVCETYAYAYDDGFGLSSCPASTLTSYEVTFYCPQ